MILTIYLADREKYLSICGLEMSRRRTCTNNVEIVRVPQ